MPKFALTLKETLCRTYIVTAVDEEDALCQANDCCFESDQVYDEEAVSYEIVGAKQANFL